MIASPDSIGPARGPAETGCRCAHCGLPVPRAQIGPGAAEQFCCGGCRAVRSLLTGAGLAGYYELRDREASRRRSRPDHPADDDAGGVTPRALEPRRSRTELDSTEFLARHARACGPALLRCEMRVDGLRCGACMWLLEALPRLQPGLTLVRVDAGRSMVRIEWAPSVTRLSAIARLFERLGYGLLPLGDPAAREADRRADRGWLVRLGVAGALASNTMAISFALYGSAFDAMDPRLRLFLQWTNLLLASLSVAFPGRVFLGNAVAALRTRTPHMDLPIAVALLAALAGGAVSSWRGGEGVYGESLSMLVFLLLVGRFVQYRRQRSARHEVELLATLMPAVARRLRADGELEDVPLEALSPGDLIQVPVGESACADGTLEGEACHLDLQTLTGESRPVRVEPGDAVWAGGRPVDRPIMVRVEKSGIHTRAGRLMAMVEEASSRRAPVVDFANRVAGWFLGAVLLLGTVTFAVWAPHDPWLALQHTVAMLVVTCPCALGLATPLTMVAAIAQAARRGILVKSAAVLEQLARPGSVILDKTGTLTRGAMEVIESEGSEAALRDAAALERESAHPAARAFEAAFAASTRPAPQDVAESPGHGVEGTVEGRRIRVGRPAFAWGGDGRGTVWGERLERILDAGLSPVAVAVDGAPAAIAGLGDPVRPEAAATIAALRRLGWAPSMASGDHPVIAAGVGRAAGLAPEEIRGGVTPEEKMHIVRGATPRPVVMVGDGVNDVAAMAVADVGVTLRSGTQAALATAQVCLSAGGVGALLPLVEGARRTMAVVRLNFAVSLAYNCVGAALAMSGMVSPLLAAILMPLSGLTVTTIALRGPRFRAAVAGTLPGHPGAPQGTSEAGAGAPGKAARGGGAAPLRVPHPGAQ